jgi:hypothetical protein
MNHPLFRFLSLTAAGLLLAPGLTWGDEATNAPAAAPTPAPTNAPAGPGALTNAPSAEVTESNRPPALAIESAEAPTTDTTASTNTAPTRIDLSTFRIVSERNIFNPNRSARVSRNGGANAEVRRQPKVDTFSLVGTLSYDQGDLAFFDGSSATFRKAIRTNDTIAGYRVVAIRTDEVQLEADGKTVSARMGARFRREDDGPWELSSNGSAVAASSGDSSASGSSGTEGAGGTETTSGSGGGGVENEVLKRLRLKREQEMKNEKP